MIKIEKGQQRQELDELMSAEEYEAYIKEESGNSHVGAGPRAYPLN
mgnify:CR=1 FL=1